MISKFRPQFLNPVDSQLPTGNFLKIVVVPYRRWIGKTATMFKRFTFKAFGSREFLCSDSIHTKANQ